MHELKDDRLKILVITSILVMGGLIFILSAGSMQAIALGRQELYFFQKQMVSVIVGFFALYTAYRVPLTAWRRFVPLLYFLTLIMLMSVFFFRPINGAHRWLILPGFSFQPSEVAKFTLVLYLSHYLVKKGDRVKEFSTGFLPASLMLGLVGALILTEPDYGTTFLLIAILFAMFMIGGASVKHLLGVFMFIAPILVAGMMMGYRKARILSFLNPWADQYKTGYQLIQSLAAVGSGSIFGKGIGNSSQKLHFLPEAHTDFIYAIISEETGLVGAVFFIILFAALFYVCVKVSKSHTDKFKRLFTFGLGFSLVVQAMLHIGVVTGVLPTKGIGLPFVSYGGSSIIVSLFIVGVLIRSAEEAQEEHNG